MNTQTTVLYEVIVPETNERIITYSREQALEYYHEEHIIFERHITVTRPSVFTDTQVRVAWRWDNNPEFNPNFWEEE